MGKKTRRNLVTFHSNAFLDALGMFRDTCEAFTVTRTGYTAMIEARGTKYLFADDPMKFHLFHLAARIKKDVRAKGLPTVDREGVKYYGFTRAKELDNLPGDAWSVDLTSAYAHALRNLDLITGETFDQLNSLKAKKDRLRVVGMLATAKTVIQYQGGKVASLEVKHSETRDAFFAACGIVGELMHETESHPGHLFFWVDGAFFDRPAQDVAEYFTGKGFPCKVEQIKNLHFSDSRRFLFYHKGEQLKYLSIPSGRRPSAEWIAQILNGNPPPTAT